MSYWDLYAEGAKYEYDNWFHPAFEKTLSAYDSLATNSTWNTIHGTSFQNIIGLPMGGRFTNIYGSDTRIVCTWTGLLGRMISGAGSTGVTGGLLLGLGGDTTLFMGNKNSFTYFSDQVDCQYSIHKFDVNYKPPDNIDLGNFPLLGAKGIYYLPVVVAVLGTLTMTVMTFCLKYIWKFTASNIAPENESAMKWAMFLFPALESRWLFVLKALHIYGYSAIPLKIEAALGEATAAVEEGKEQLTVLESQLEDIECEIEVAKSRIDAWEIQIQEDHKVLAKYPWLVDFVLLKSGKLIQQMNEGIELLTEYESKKASIINNIAEQTGKNTESAAKLAELRS
jgi:hypothetical protein